MYTLEEIKKIVTENAKKGNATPTKYVGTYNYKSGYDTYFALSFDKNKNLVVYSYYQNDRGEHIDTYTKKLSELSEKEFNGVCENIGTIDKDTRYMIESWKFEESVKSILAYINLYKPKAKKESYKLDLDSIPNLENNDLYYIDKNHKVGILKCLGKSFFKEANIYSYLGKVFEESLPLKDGYDGSLLADRARKAKGCFKVLENGDEYTEWKIIVVESRDKLKELFDAANNLRDWFMVSKDHGACFIENNVKPNEEHAISFNTKKDAIAYYNDFKEKQTKSLKKYIKTIDEKIKVLKRHLDKYHPQEKVNVNELVVGKTYIASLGYYNDSKKFTVDSVDELGFIHVKENGAIIRTDVRLLEIYEDVPIENADIANKLDDIVDSLEYFKERIEENIEGLEEYIPFVDESIHFCGVSSIKDMMKSALSKAEQLEKKIESIN